MDENKTNQGAPSSDSTSALFVSARKKQLAQQEEERVAAEKEAARVAAEEEVRRLELEVEERKRKAQEDAKRVEEEAQERRRLAQAEEERMRREGAQFTAPQQNVAYSQPAMPQNSAVAQTSAAKPNEIVEKAKAIAQEIIQDKKKLGIAIGVAVGVLVLIIILASLGGGSSIGSYEYAFVNDLDPSLGYFNLYEDGTADGVSILGEEFTGTWVGGNGAVAIYVNDIEFAIYEVVDNTSYVDALTGAYYYYYPAYVSE